MPERGSYRQTVPIEGEDDEDVHLVNPLDLPPTYEEASTTSLGSGARVRIGAGATATSQTRTSGPSAHQSFRDKVNSAIDDDGEDCADTELLSGYRPERAPERDLERSSDSRPRSPVDTLGYTSTEPMMWEERTRNGHWDKYKGPGFCFSTRDGCFFSDRAGCCFSDRGGCVCSDREGCCFSDRGGCFCSDLDGCCFSSGGACFCSGPPDFVKRNTDVRL